MASDNKASYAKIGFTVFIGVIAVAVALIYIAGIGDRSNELLVETYYDNPVSGLSVGSAVNFRGVKIGEVRAIEFVTNIYEEDSSAEDMQRISILMALDARKLGVSEKYPFGEILDDYGKQGLRATVAASSITGLSRIELNIPPNPLPPAKLSWTPRHPLIPPQPSLLESFSLSATKALNQLNKMNFAAVWSNVSSVAASTAKLTSDVSDFVSAEKEGLAEIVRHVGEAARKIDEASSSVDELTETLKQNPSLLLRPADPEPLEETSK